MKIISWLGITLILAAFRTADGATPEIFGYFESQAMGASLHNDNLLLSSNKLRLDVGGSPSDGVQFGANVNFFNYNGTTRFNALDYLPDRVADQVLPGTEPYYEFTYRDSIGLDNAYLKLSFRRWDLTVGKQQISYGTGYAWNPTDLFNFKNILDPTYEQPGNNALRLDLPLSRGTTVVGVYAPGTSWDNPTAMARLKTRLSRFDLSASLLTTSRETVFYPAFTVSREDRRLVGFDFAGQLFGLGIWGEGAYNFMEKTDDFWEAVFGCDYTFRNGFYLLAEFYNNSSAPTASEDYTLNSWMNYFTGNLKTIGRSQAYIFLQYPLTDLMTPGGSIIGCLNDGSFALVPQLDYSLFQDVVLTGFGYIYLGDEGTMYARNLGDGGLLRLTVYF
jgi:hypothetical protein